MEHFPVKHVRYADVIQVFGHINCIFGVSLPLLCLRHQPANQVCDAEIETSMTRWLCNSDPAQENRTYAGKQEVRQRRGMRAEWRAVQGGLGKKNRPHLLHHDEDGGDWLLLS